MSRRFVSGMHSIDRHPVPSGVPVRVHHRHQPSPYRGCRYTRRTVSCISKLASRLAAVHKSVFEVKERGRIRRGVEAVQMTTPEVRG